MAPVGPMFVRLEWKSGLASYESPRPVFGVIIAKASASTVKAAAMPSPEARFWKAPRSSFASERRVMPMMFALVPGVSVRFSPSGMFLCLISPASVSVSSTPNVPGR
jgi:hypothetical protein